MTRSPRRPPVAALLVTAVLALQALALLWLAADALRQVGGGVLPTGAQVFLVVVYALVGAWVAFTAVGMLRGRASSRGATTAVQLFGVLLSSWLVSMGEGALGAALLVLSGVALVAVFTRPVTRHLAGDGAQPRVS